MARVYETDDTSIVRGSDNTSSFIAILALVVAFTALGLAWAAYNRSGEDLENQIQQGIENTTESTQEAAEDAGEAGQDASDAVEQGLDTGPDGVDDGNQ